jgi:hypothetical protein
MSQDDKDAALRLLETVSAKIPDDPDINKVLAMHSNF